MLSGANKANIFVAVEPKKGKRTVKVTERRTKRDFALFVKEILEEYPKARKLYIVLDNLNTHFPGSFEEAFGKKEKERIMSKVGFHCTPKRRLAGNGIGDKHDGQNNEQRVHREGNLQLRIGAHNGGRETVLCK